MRLPLAAWLLLLACLLLAGLLPVFVKIVPNETLGVRRRSGVATGVTLGRGLHFKVPGFYDIRVIKRHIHLSAIPLADGVSTASLGWVVADAPRFHALVATLDESLETLAGEAAILPVLEVTWRARPKPRHPFDEAAAEVMRDKLNAALLTHHGIKIVTLQITSVRAASKKQKDT